MTRIVAILRRAEPIKQDMPRGLCACLDVVRPIALSAWIACLYVAATC